MGSRALQRLAAFGALIALYQFGIAAIPLCLGVFKQNGIEFAGVPYQAQDSGLIELLNATQQARHASAVALTSMSNLGQGLALRETIGSGAAFLLFAAIICIERNRCRRSSI